MFSIIIPTFNNIKYLKICIESIKKNSTFNHEIIAHVNLGEDGTKEYLDKENIEYTFTNYNAGICEGMNKATKKAKFDYILYSHDDFYGYKNKQPVWADNFKNALLNSKMGINLSQGPSTKYYSSDRITQLIGNGLMTFIDKKTMLNKFFNNNEVVFYNSIKDLSKKINMYNENDKLRIKIAKNGKNKYLKYFNSKNVAKFIIQKTFNLKYKNKYLWE